MERHLFRGISKHWAEEWVGPWELNCHEAIAKTDELGVDGVKYKGKSFEAEDVGDDLAMLVIWDLFACNGGLDGIVDDEEDGDESTDQRIVKSNLWIGIGGKEMWFH